MGTAIGVPASAITRLTLTVTRPVLAPMRMARDETRSLLAAQLEVMALFTTATLQGPLYRLGLLHPSSALRGRADRALTIEPLGS